MTVDPVWSHLRFYSCCFEHKVQTKYFPREFTRTQDCTPRIFGCCCNLKAYWPESIRHPFYIAFRLGFFTVYIQWSSTLPLRLPERLSSDARWSNEPQCLLSIQRANKINLTASLCLVTVSGLRSDLKCTCRTRHKNVESMPWRLWAGRQIFPFINPLTMIAWKACGTAYYFENKLSAICWIFSSFETW